MACEPSPASGILLGSRIGQYSSWSLSPSHHRALAEPVPVDQLPGQALEPEVLIHLLSHQVECPDCQSVVLLTDAVHHWATGPTGSE